MVPKNEPSEVKKSRNSRKVQNFNFLRLRRPERICSGLAPGKRCLRGVESAKSAKSLRFDVKYPPWHPSATSAHPPGYLGAPPLGSMGARLPPWRPGPLRGALLCPWLPRRGGRCAARGSAPGYLGAEAAARRAGLPLATSVRRPLRYAATSVRRGR